MPTIKDVAKQLNISITTVSRALDGYDDVAEETRALVIRTAREMGYTPNRAARQLRRQKTETIGFILPTSAQRMDESFFAMFIAGLGDEVSVNNFDLLVSNASNDEMEAGLYQRWVSSHKVDGFVLNRVCQHDWRVRYLAQAGIPFSGMGLSQDEVDYPHIFIDGAQGYLALVKHILQNGFRRMAFIGGQTSLLNHQNRLGWFRAALDECGLPCDEQLLASADMTSTGGYEAAQRLLNQPARPDAILCMNDETAFGALHASHERGLNVGSEIAIAGFDGVQDARHTQPPLTTLETPVYEIARKLVKMLLGKLSGQPCNNQTIYPTLLMRASTGRQSTGNLGETSTTRSSKT